MLCYNSEHAVGEQNYSKNYRTTRHVPSHWILRIGLSVAIFNVTQSRKATASPVTRVRTIREQEGLSHDKASHSTSQGFVMNVMHIWGVEWYFVILKLAPSAPSHVIVLISKSHNHNRRLRITLNKSNVTPIIVATTSRALIVFDLSNILIAGASLILSILFCHV